MRRCKRRDAPTEAAPAAVPSRMPKLTPIALASVPTGAGSDPKTYAANNPGKVLLQKDGTLGDGVDVLLKVANAAVGLRPWFWTEEESETGGGVWQPLGFDAVNGPGPATADPALGKGTAHGRYQDSDSGGRSWILVAETGLVANVLWAHLVVNRRSVTTT